MARRRLFLAAAAALFLAAVALGVLAFTRFDGEPVPSPGSPGFADYEGEQIRDARLSVGLGLGAAFALAGALACLDRGRRPSSLPPQP